MCITSPAQNLKNWKNLIRSRPSGALTGAAEGQGILQTSAHALKSSLDGIEKEGYQCSARIEPTSGESGPIAYCRSDQTKMFRPYRAVIGGDGGQRATSSLRSKRWQSTSVSLHLYRGLVLPTRPDPQNLLVIDLPKVHGTCRNPIFYPYVPVLHVHASCSPLFINPSC